MSWGMQALHRAPAPLLAPPEGSGGAWRGPRLRRGAGELGAGRASGGERGSLARAAPPEGSGAGCSS